MSNYGSSGNGWAYASQLHLITVDGMALSPYGTIDHSDLFNNAGDTYWNSVDIRRSIFMGDFIYAVSGRGITVHALQSGLPQVAQASLPGTLPGDYYWWW
jgi:hypothetical protein